MAIEWFPTRSEMRQRAKTRRLHPTGAEAVLRAALKRAGERRLRRQMPLGRVIVDLAIPSRNLIIETDGPWLNRDVDRDNRRDTWLRTLGFNVIRFSNDEILTDVASAVKAVQQYMLSEQQRQRFLLACRTAQRSLTPPLVVNDFRRPSSQT
jgi:guanylate kinase